MPSDRASFPPAGTGSRENLSLIAALVLLVAVVAAGIGIYAWQKHEEWLREVKIASEYAKASSLSERLALIKRHRDIPQSALWLLQTASAQFQEGAYAEATKSFQEFLGSFPKHPLRPAALLGTAAGLEAEGKREEAIRSYRALIDEGSADPFRLVAEIQLARLDIEQKQYAPAKALLDAIRRRKPVNRFEGVVQELQDRLPP